MRNLNMLAKRIINFARVATTTGVCGLGFYATGYAKTSPSENEKPAIKETPNNNQSIKDSEIQTIARRR